MLQMFWLHKACGGKFFSIRNLLCKKSANFVPSKSINLKSYSYDVSFFIGIDWN